MIIPKMPKGFFLLIADGNTGIFLNVDGTYHLNTDTESEFYIHAPTLDEIRKNADKILSEKPNTEVLIYDSDDNFIEMKKNW